MAKFKKGDKVITTRNCVYYNKVEVLAVDEDDSCIPWCLRGSGERVAICEQDIKLYIEEKTEIQKRLDNMKYKVGDILVNDIEWERIVLSANGLVYVMSSVGGFDEYGGTYTQEQLDRYQYKLKTPKETIEISKEDFEKLEESVKSQIKIINKNK